MSTSDTDGLGEVEIEATINGVVVRRRVEARQHLADFLRIELELTGTHLGCEHGVCGACTVLIDGRTARGCLTLAAQISGHRVDTVEGLSDSGELAALQKAFIARNAAQCGFCSSGMLLTAYELVSKGGATRVGLDGTATRKAMTRAEVRDTLSGNLCRCTGYQAIIDAVATVLDAAHGVKP